MPPPGQICSSVNPPHTRLHVAFEALQSTVSQHCLWGLAFVWPSFAHPVFCSRVAFQTHCLCYSTARPRLRCFDFWKSETSCETLLFRCAFWKSGGHIWNRKPNLELALGIDVLAVTQSKSVCRVLKMYPWYELGMAHFYSYFTVITVKNSLLDTIIIRKSSSVWIMCIQYCCDSVQITTFSRKH